MALLANLAAELLDRGVIKLTERVEVGNLLVVIESGRGTLLESEVAYIHRDHASADKRVDVVKGTSLIFLLSIGEVVTLSSLAAGGASGAPAALALTSRAPVCQVFAIVDSGWSVGRFLLNLGWFQSNPL